MRRPRYNSRLIETQSYKRSKTISVQPSARQSQRPNFSLSFALVLNFLVQLLLNMASNVRALIDMQLKGIALLPVLAAIAFAAFMMTGTAFAQEEGGGAAAAESSAFKFIAAGIAFGLAALGAGFGLGFVGAAGLAAISENPKMQSSVFIIVGMVESIAIYGIVMMFIILGQS
jgi:V/A-type H+/Na+-transporting ATPase subunit K